jgi:hypothetical protein
MVITREKISMKKTELVCAALLMSSWPILAMDDQPHASCMQPPRDEWFEQKELKAPVQVMFTAGQQILASLKENSHHVTNVYATLSGSLKAEGKILVDDKESLRKFEVIMTELPSRSAKEIEFKVTYRIIEPN